MNETDRSQLVIQRRDRSLAWMEANYYPEWESVFKSYMCEKDPEKDYKGNEDDTQTAIGMPDTWSLARRTVARVTAQIPNLRFHTKEFDLAELISRTLMYCWDKGGVQRWQKLHVLQAALFGWSVRPWYWSVDECLRSKRVNPLDPVIPPDLRKQIIQIHRPDLEAAEPRLAQISDDQIVADQNLWASVAAKILAASGRGGLIRVKYLYRSYEGPKCDFLSVGDCFPEPGFRTIQDSNWFIVERRRNKEWMQRAAKAYPNLAAGFDEMVTSAPHGTPYGAANTERTRLVVKLANAIDKNTNDELESTDEGSDKWTIIEQHCPGAEPTITYVGENGTTIGEIPYPYDLDGKIAFTELVLIDSLLSGIGDATARVVRGLQTLHDRQTNVRFDLIYNILRPLVRTASRELYDNPDMLKRHKGFRLFMGRPGDLEVIGEQAAIAAAAAGLQDEGGILRMWQQATGESNMSMMANVDPQQSRTATGAKLMQANLDVLTRDLIDAFVNTSVAADAEMMYLLNRSELSDTYEIDSSKYNRDYRSMRNSTKEQWQKVEPMMFQIDGEIVVEAGSTLADDDEAKTAKATDLLHAAQSMPQLFNMETARDEYLIAMGKGRELARWAPKKPEGPPPPEMRTTLTVSVKMEDLNPQTQQAVLEAARIQAPHPSPPPPGGQALPQVPPPGFVPPPANPPALPTGGVKP